MGDATVSCEADVFGPVLERLALVGMSRPKLRKAGLAWSAVHVDLPVFSEAHVADVRVTGGEVDGDTISRAWYSLSRKG